MSTAKQLDKIIDEKSQKLVEIIRDKTEDTERWVVFKHRDIPALLDTSAFSVKKIIENVKMHPNIMFEEVELAKSSRKPFQFRYVTEEEKINKGFSEKNFYYLNQEEINMIVKRLALHGNYQENFKFLSIMNILSRDGAKEKFVKVNVKHLSDLFIMSRDEILGRINQLIDYRLLSSAGIADNMYMLLLNSESISKSKLMIESQDKTFAPTSLTLTQMDTIEDEGFSIVSQNDMPKELAESFDKKVEEVRDTFKSFMSFCDSQAQFIADFYKTKEDEKTRLVQSYDSVNRLLEETKSLKQRIVQLETMNRAYDNTLRTQDKKKDAIERFMQETFDILIADIMHTVTEFTHTPPLKQTTAIRSRFERNIVDSVTKASDEIIHYKYDPEAQD